MTLHHKRSHTPVQQALKRHSGVKLPSEHLIMCSVIQACLTSFSHAFM